MWTQKQIIIPQKERGMHLITELIESQLPELLEYKIGLLNLFIQHTSASITINENADPTVRGDFENYLNEIIPEDTPYFIHTYEGPDDMPAHIKSSILGSSLSIPITNGVMNLGTWQGVYLFEHRNNASPRKIIATISGQV
ncbi:secondary thiamine-phosphate synthase enzyme YjbQ [Pseudoalteromonas xiamenensis]|uniref:YjbQ family protein n=1 Tax=Pseudoalteromonas xiamenensis TaxID=882626 RepID=A0A975DFF3_9GAMM|nr:secondary thiamine-phosphate synthase enzyme YjbQ [Pseudoalteromonas xiamenensis]QTH70594.1 YjbQ family protein [Pseudoalteromonas xiamenensis]